MRASTMLEHEEKYAVILAFDVKVRMSNICSKFKSLRDCCDRLRHRGGVTVRVY
jgi:hypothetical protein